MANGPSYHACLHISAPRSNPNIPSVKGPAVKARAPTPELPTVPCLPPSLLGSLQPEPLACTDTEAEAEENQEEVEEDIREYNRSVAEAIQTMVATITNTLREERDEVGELPPALLTPDTDTFTIPASSCPKYINIHFIGEAASRVLFSTVHWIRQLPFFSSLSSNNQTKLLRRSWLELFVLGLAQAQTNLRLDEILAAVVDNVKTVADMDRSSLTRVRQVTQNICKLKEYVTAINKLELSSIEFGLLKIIAMFNSDPASANADFYERVNDKALSELRDQAKNKERGMETRYSKLLLRLSPLRSLQEDVFEEIFFGGLIGNVQIETVIPILLKMGDNELQQYLKCEN